MLHRGCVQPRARLGAEGRPRSPQVSQIPPAPHWKAGARGQARGPRCQAAGAGESRRPWSTSRPPWRPGRSFRPLSPSCPRTPAREKRPRRGATSREEPQTYELYQSTFGRKMPKSPRWALLESKPPGPQRANSKARSYPSPNCGCGRARGAARGRDGTRRRSARGHPEGSVLKPSDQERRAVSGKRSAPSIISNQLSKPEAGPLGPADRLRPAAGPPRGRGVSAARPRNALLSQVGSWGSRRR